MASCREQLLARPLLLVRQTAPKIFQRGAKQLPTPLTRQIPRITLFIDALAQEANHRRNVFLCEVRVKYVHELGHYFGWDEGQITNLGLA